MKEALATGSEAGGGRKPGRNGYGKKTEIIGSLFGGATRRETKHTPDTACLGLHHWRNRSSSKRAASDDGAYCRNGCLALEYGA